jgi:hypothetical protein
MNTVKNTVKMSIDLRYLIDKCPYVNFFTDIATMLMLYGQTASAVAAGSVQSLQKYSLPKSAMTPKATPPRPCCGQACEPGSHHENPYLVPSPMSGIVHPPSTPRSSKCISLPPFTSYVPTFRLLKFLYIILTASIHKSLPHWRNPLGCAGYILCLLLSGCSLWVAMSGMSASCLRFPTWFGAGIAAACAACACAWACAWACACACWYAGWVGVIAYAALFCICAKFAWAAELGDCPGIWFGEGQGPGDLPGEFSSLIGWAAAMLEMFMFIGC